MKDTPQYKDLKFESQEAFEKWLNDTATKTIELEDLGQDLLTLWIDDGGEILHTNLQSNIWCGNIVNTDTLSVGKPLELKDMTLKYFVIKIEKKK